ncbi:MAG: hypothetical protein M1817_003388 [Caeruleum heppii]|nr:MAG: hypothetical protein M1817_003388 [Caeruleum heppii]
MSEGSSSLAPRQDHHKLLSKQHWKGKIFSSEKDTAKQTEGDATRDQDVTDFLKPSTSRPTGLSSNISPAQQLQKLDIASAKKWPSASEVRQWSTDSPFGQSFRSSSRGKSSSPKRSKKGLHVTFADTQPEIIGEGGDDADAPPTDISAARARSHSPVIRQNLGWSDQQGPQRNNEHSAQRRPPRQSVSSGQVMHDEPFRPVPLGRRPTGLDPTSGATAPGSTPRRKPIADSKLSSERETQMTSMLQQPDKFNPQSPVAMVQAQMRAEEGSALQKRMEANSSGPEHPLVDHRSASQGYDDPSSARQTPSARSSHDYSQIWAESELFGRAQQREHQPPSRGRSSPSSTINPSLSPSRRSRTTSLEEFVSRTQHLGKLFELAAESVRSKSNTTVEQWARVSLWWFLRGRNALEHAIRAPASSAQERGSSASPSTLVEQAYVDLAKTWWVSDEILPQYPEWERSARSSNSPRRYLSQQPESSTPERCQSVIHNVLESLRALTMSMERHGFFPPSPDEPLLSQGLDPTIWLETPQLESRLLSRLSRVQSSSSRGQDVGIDLASAIPLCDTAKTFSYGRSFVEVSPAPTGRARPNYKLSCVLSTFRERSSVDLKAILVNQDGTFNLSLQPRADEGLSWNDVTWRKAHDQILIDLGDGFDLNVQFAPRDYKNLRAIYAMWYNMRRQKMAQEKEEVVLEDVVQSVIVNDNDHETTGFPPRCESVIRLMDKVEAVVERGRRRKVHQGFRLFISTGVSSKTLSYMSINLNSSDASAYRLYTGEHGEPVLNLRTPLDDGQRTTVISFQTEASRARFITLLEGAALQSDEMIFPDLPLQRLSIQVFPSSEDASRHEEEALRSIIWQRLRIVDWIPEEAVDDPQPSSRSGGLRLCARFGNGLLTDRLDPGSVPLLWCLPDQSPTTIQVVRPPQRDMSELTERVRADLHSFQVGLTGWAVLFDGIASTYAFSRPRKVLPMHKKWDNGAARMQVLKRGQTTHLVAFLRDGSHGRCMSSLLKSTDVFEGYSKSSKYFIRFVDATFALPEDDSTPSSAYVCLDDPPYPDEHDDISIGFDHEEGRALLEKALPGPVGRVSRIASLRRSSSESSGEASTSTDSEQSSRASLSGDPIAALVSGANDVWIGGQQPGNGGGLQMPFAAEGSVSESQQPPDVRLHHPREQTETWMDFLQSSGNVPQNASPVRSTPTRSSYTDGPFASQETDQPLVDGTSSSSQRGASQSRPSFVLPHRSSSRTTAAAGIDARSSSTQNVDNLTESPRAILRDVHSPPRTNRASREIILPRWQPDDEVTNCPICGTRFTFWHRKHHCRKCGKVVCALCSPHRITIPKQFIVHPPLAPDADQLPARGVDLTEDHESYGVEDNQPGSPTTPVTDGNLDRLQSALGGGEEVRICNPCVPDPNLTPPPQSERRRSSQSMVRDMDHGALGEGSTSREAERRRRRRSQRAVISAQEQYFGLGPSASAMDDELMTPGGVPSRLRAVTSASEESVHRQYRGAYNGAAARVPNPNWSLIPPRYSSAFSNVTPNPSSSAPGPDSLQDRYPPARRVSHRHAPSAGSNNPRLRSMLDVDTPSSRRHSRHDSQPPPPRLAEEDFCPVCRMVLPPRDAEHGESQREQHVQDCIAQHFSSSSSGPSHPPAEAAQAAAVAATGLGRAPSQASSSSPSAGMRPRRATGGPSRMVTYLATEKDCVNSGGDGPAECVICFEEFEPGVAMARLECLCKFHRGCIVAWWETKGPGACPVHQANEG